MKFIITLLCLLSPLYSLAESPASTNGTIEAIGDEYGNLETSITQVDLDSLALVVGDNFTLTFGQTSVSVHLGKTYEDVELGMWISFVNWEKKLRIARNTANAAETLNAKVGDVFSITKITSE